MRRIFIAALAVGMTAVATPAFADQPVPTDLANCNIVTPNPDAVACSGYYDQNVLSNNSLDLNAQAYALAHIGEGGNVNNGTRVGAVFNWDTSLFNTLTTGTLNSSGPNAGLLTFGQNLLGITYIAIHFGNANTGIGDRTVFYEFNFASPTAGIALNEQGYSNSVLYTTTRGGVPEPATWAMMLLGFGGIGMAMRRKQRRNSALMQVA